MFGMKRENSSISLLELNAKIGGEEGQFDEQIFVLDKSMSYYDKSIVLYYFKIISFLIFIEY
jgi:hypothetical protein